MRPRTKEEKIALVKALLENGLDAWAELGDKAIFSDDVGEEKPMKVCKYCGETAIWRLRADIMTCNQCKGKPYELSSPERSS